MRSRVFSALAAIAVAATALIGVQATPALATGGFSGIVTDTSGVPIPGATVTAASSAFASAGDVPSAQTGADGAFALLGVPPFFESYRLLVTAPGFTPTYVGSTDFYAATAYPVTADESYSGITAPLLRADAVIQGTITGPNGPLSGASVRVAPASTPPGFGFNTVVFTRTVLTDSAGGYRADGLLAETTYTVDVTPPAGSGLLNASYGFPGGQLPVTAEGRTETADVRVFAPGSISGTITDPDGLPVEGATVIASGFPEPIEATSGPDGTFLITGVFPGEIGFFAAPPAGSDLLFTYYGNTIDGGLGLTVVEGQTTTGADIQLQAGARFTTVVPGGSPGETTLAACLAPATPGYVDTPWGPNAQCGDRPALRVYDGSGLIPVGSINVAAAANTYPPPPLSATATLDVVRGRTYTCTHDLLGTGSFTCAVDGGPPADTTPPVITCPADANYLLHQRDATLVAQVTDEGSGVAQPTIEVGVTTGTVGASTTAVTATDLAGNTATASCDFSVGVSIDRVLKPRTDRLTRVRAGSVLPVMYRVVDANGRGVATRAHFDDVTIEPVTCPSLRTAHSFVQPNEGLRKIGGGFWINGVRVPQTTGCYSVRLDVVGDSVTTFIRIV